MASAIGLRAAEQVTISEFLAANTVGLRDEDNQLSDWIELQNSGTTAVNLDGWFLTDNVNNLTKWRFPATNIAAGGFLIVFADSADRAVAGRPLHTSFNLSASGEYLALVKPDGVTLATEFTPKYPGQAPDVSFGFTSFATNTTVVSSNSSVRWRIPTGTEGTNWTATNYNDSSWAVGTNGVGFGNFAPADALLVKTDVGAVMSNVNASVYIRIPFSITSATNISLISLRMRYNDGFVASINGIDVVRVNAPMTNTFNSTATNVHSSLVSEEVRLGPGTLVSGTNILAIQGLNVAANDTNFFIGAEVIVTAVEAASSTPVFFTVPTPGSNNVGGIVNPGPSIANVSHSPTVPSDAQDVIVTAKITPTFYPLSNVVMRYRIMFGAEIELPMFDDGAHGDGAAADGVYGATIPESASISGQMIRWYFRATDIRGNLSRWPIFSKPNDSAEFLGTVVNPDYVTSKLPIVHLFAPAAILQPGPVTTQTAADSQAGAQVSLFFDGEFYDNIHMELRGNSTAGFNKKSHRVEFNREHPFRYSNTADRIRKTSWTADWPDPTYMRQGLTFWLGDVFGAPSPFYEPMRLQLNGQFYQLANHNDVHGEEFLQRIGYDPNGALYNSAGQVTPGKASTGGFDKKTRTWQNDADYTNLAVRVAESVPLAARAANIFDLFDVPQAISYMTVGRWVHENDDVWANMTMYHDNDGDDLWRIIPFDMNLSWGAIFAEGDASLYTGVQATNDTHKSHPLYGGSQILARSGPGGGFNRVYDAFFQNPDTRQMYLRRLRTLLDTYIKPIGTPTNSTFLEQMILAKRDLIAEEANRDRAWWGWPAVGGQNNFAPGIDITNGVNQMLDQFLRTRRVHFYGKHGITNTALPLFDGSLPFQSNTVAGIPFAQPTNVVVNIGQIESNPSSGLQGHEFIQLTNGNPFAVDISGWKLSNGVSFTFKPGTVLPSNGVLYVTPDLKAFRTRTTTPKTNQALYVIGNYKGQLDARGELLILLDDTGRIVHTNGYVPSPSPAQLYLRITELMYHPARTNATSPYLTEDFEYIELKNIGPVNLSLVGIHFTNGVEFTFQTNSAVTNLAPGQFVMLVKNAAAFVSRYGAGATIAGVYAGNLDSNGERVSLHDAVGEQILDFTYNNTWYPITDGLGFSLVIINENADWKTWDLKESWRPSAADNGSPGSNDPAAPGPFAPMLVNELLTHSVFPDVDKIEIYNPTANAVDIGNWWISDDYFTPHKYRIPAPRVVAAGGFTVFFESDFNVGSNGFSFSSKGDEAFLFSGNASGQLNGYVHGFDFGGAEPSVSFGRYVDSQTNTHFVAQSSNTFSSANSKPKVGPIVISEIMYHPPDVGTIDNRADEFVELQNISSNAVPLYDLAFPTNRWELDDAVHFSFSASTTIPAGGRLVVVSFDPSNVVALANFRANYGLGTNVAIVGPYSGELNNAEDSVELKKPDTSAPTNIAIVLVDRVHYHDTAPWNPAADGLGAALQRIVLADFGNDPTNWIATAPNPGGRVIGGTLPVFTAQPANTTGVAGRTTNTFTVAATGALRYQWFGNGTNIPGATNATLVLPNVQAAQAGDYYAIALNGAGLAVSSNAHLTVLTPVTFVQQPFTTNLAPATSGVLPGTNVTFTALAVGTGTVRYQWQFEGVNILNATNAVYTFPNALIPNQGNYSVVAIDDISTTVSSNFFLWVLVRPGYVQQPQNVTVLQGQTAVFSVIVTGSPPIFYRWIRGGTPYITSSVPVLVLTNCQASLSIRVAVTNIATGLGGINSSTVQLTVLPDNDGDGMADTWEILYGFNTNNMADGFLDLDGDGMINRDEYVAGTDPTDPLSLLKLVRTATNSAALQFVAQTNLSYTLQYRTNLTSANWSNFTSITAQSFVRTVEVIVPKPPPEPARFYRIITPTPILP